MQMTCNEIITKYLQSDNHKEKIKILAQLNGCDKAEIETILKGAGYMKLFQGNRDLSVSLDRIIKLRAEGKTQTQIAKLLNTEQTYISKLLRENAPEENPEKPVKNSEKIKKEVSEAPKAKLEVARKEFLQPEEKEASFEVAVKFPEKFATGGIVSPDITLSGLPDFPNMSAEIEAASQRNDNNTGRCTDGIDSAVYAMGANWGLRYNAEPFKLENVKHPSQSDYKPIDVIDSWNLGFDLGSVVECISRVGERDRNSEIQELEKAKFYLEHRIKKLRGSAGNANS